jgi:hypothetical protein
LLPARVGKPVVDTATCSQALVLPLYTNITPLVVL